MVEAAGPEPAGEIRPEAARVRSSPLSPLSSSVVGLFVVSPTDPSLPVVGLCCAAVESSKNQATVCHPSLLPVSPSSLLPSLPQTKTTGQLPWARPCSLLPASPSLTSGLWSASSPSYSRALAALVGTFWMAVGGCLGSGQGTEHGQPYSPRWGKEKRGSGHLRRALVKNVMLASGC